MLKRKKYNISGFILLFLIISFVFTVFSAFDTDSMFMSTIIESAEIEAKEFANNSINNSINKTINELDVSADNFYKKSNDFGNLSISADTILINLFCSELSNNINEKLSLQTENIIKVPVGSMFGIDIISNIGPDIGFSVIPISEAMVDYNTEFNSVGINQTNFKIWIDISTRVKIINPLQKKEILFQRKLMLVDIVTEGEVPENYIQFYSDNY